MKNIYTPFYYAIVMLLLVSRLVFSQGLTAPISGLGKVGVLTESSTINTTSGTSNFLTIPNDSDQVKKILNLRVNRYRSYGDQYIDKAKLDPLILNQLLGVGSHLRKAAELTFNESKFRYFLRKLKLAKAKTEASKYDFSINKIDTRFLQFLYAYIANNEEIVSKDIREQADKVYGDAVGALPNSDTKQFEFEMEKIRVVRDKGIEESLEHKKMFVKYNYLAKTVQSMRLCPVTNALEAEFYYNNLISSKGYSILRSALFTYNPTLAKASLFSEIFSDFIGPFRVALGTQITNKSEVTKDSAGIKVVDKSEQTNESIQRILGGGGNFVLSLGFPLSSYKNKAQTLSFLTTFQPKFSLDVPQIGTEVSDVNWSGDLGVDVGLYGLGLKGVIIPYLTSRHGFLVGSDSFYKYLGITDEKNRSFWLHQSTFGLAITSLFRVGVTFYYGDPFVVKNFPTSVSVNIIPGR